MRLKTDALSLPQLHQGFVSALVQAERLADESRALARKKLFAGALSKAILGLEEVGKNRLFLYQAGTVVLGTPRPWSGFWRSYRSHKEKLELAMTWASILSPDLVSGDDVSRHIKFISDEAQRLDVLKQRSQYADFDGDSFTVPSDETVREEALELGTVLKGLCCSLREQYPIDLPQDEFLELVREKIRLSRTLGFFPPDGGVARSSFPDAVADGNSPVLARDGVLPSEHAFRTRVAERYEIVPSKLPVTLHTLNRSAEYAKFYAMLKERYRYPDWVVVSTIYNLAFNARVRPSLTEPPDEATVARWLEWAEEPDSESLPVELFTDEKSFDVALEMWLMAFLAGLGIQTPDIAADDMTKVRRIASRYYSVFEYDIEHWPIFEFPDEGDPEAGS